MFLFICGTSHAATTYWKRNTNPTNNNWNQADNWSTVSSASATNTGTYPVAGDTANFDAGSIQCTINVASACAVLNMSNYANTLTFTSTLATTGAVTLGGTLAGAGVWTMNTSCTITTNGKTISGGLTLAGTSQTYTLSGNLAVTGTILCSGTTLVTIANGTNTITAGNINMSTCSLSVTGGGAVTVNTTLTVAAYTLTIAHDWQVVNVTFSGNAIFQGAYNLKVSGNFNQTPSYYTGGTGTTTIYFNGGGAQLWTGNNGAITNPMTINCSGTLTLSATTSFQNTLTYMAGTVNTSTNSNSFIIPSNATLLTDNGATKITFNNISFTGTQTLQSNLTATGTVSIVGASVFSGAYTVSGGLFSLGAGLTYVSDWTMSSSASFGTNAALTNGTGNVIKIAGGLTLSAPMATSTGTVLMNGSGTISCTTTNMIKCNLTINTAGTIHFADNCGFQSGTLTYTAGTVIWDGTGTFFLTSSSTLNCSSMTFTSLVHVNSAMIITLNADLHATTLANNVSGGGITYGGTGNIYAGTLNMSAGGKMILAAGKNLNIATAWYSDGTRASATSIISGTASSPVYINYTGTSSNYRVTYMTATDVNASGSNQLILDYGATVTRGVNIVSIPPAIFTGFMAQ